MRSIGRGGGPRLVVSWNAERVTRPLRVPRPTGQHMEGVKVEAALNEGMSGAVSYAATFVGNFVPVLLWIGGISIGMWVLVFARDYFRG